MATGVSIKNCRPIASVSCLLEPYGGVLLQRLEPVLDPMLDDAQAGFWWGALDHAYVPPKPFAYGLTFLSFVKPATSRSALGPCDDWRGQVLMAPCLMAVAFELA